MADTLPTIAISVRQPWAWAIVHGGKDIENRCQTAVVRGAMKAQIGQRIAIHAAKGITREEYEDARDFMASIGVKCPEARYLRRGGVIGSAMLTDIVRKSESKWFFGPYGLVLADVRPCEFIPARGQLGMFRWERGPWPSEDDTPRWMKAPKGAPQAARDEMTLELFDAR